MSGALSVTLAGRAGIAAQTGQNETARVKQAHHANAEAKSIGHAHAYCPEMSFCSFFCSAPGSAPGRRADDGGSTRPCFTARSRGRPDSRVLRVSVYFCPAVVTLDRTHDVERRHTLGCSRKTRCHRSSGHEQGWNQRHAHPFRPAACLATSWKEPCLTISPASVKRMPSRSTMTSCTSSSRAPER